MKTLWEREAREELKQRLRRLDPTRGPRWGRMNAPQMLVHLNEAMRMCLNELPVAPRRLPIRYTPLKQMIIYWLPWPKGAPTAPELLEGIPGEWQTDVASMCAYVDQFATRSREGPWPQHPAFGRMSSRAWGVLGYRHIDHHLRQFGA
jgi:hypothetical protein